MRLTRFEEPGGRPGVALGREDQVVEIAQDWLTALAQCSGGSPRWLDYFRATSLVDDRRRTRGSVLSR